MRVLHVNDHLAPKGGVETYLLDVIPRLEEMGYMQGVVFGNGLGECVDCSYHVPDVSAPGWGNRGRVNQELQNVLRDFQPDLVHLHNIHNADAIEYLMDERPVVITAHDYRYLCPASNFYYRKSESVCPRACGLGCFAVTLTKRCMTPRPQYGWKYFRRVMRTKKRFSDVKHLVAPSKAAADRFVENGFPQENTTVLPYFCRIAPCDSPRPVPEDPMILYVGRLSENKGWHYFIQALGMLPNVVRGCMVGNFDAGTLQRLNDQAAMARCQDRIEVIGWSDASGISEVMRRATILVFPSLWPETLGIVGLEAMAHGVPTVASDIGGVTEWLVDGKTGFLVPPKDPNAIAGKALRLIKDPRMNEVFGQASIAHLKSKFLPQQHIHRLIEIYHSATLSKSDGR